MKVGDTLEINISGITQGLDAVGRYQGFTVFVPGGVPGDRLSVRVRVVKKNYARAEIIQIKTPSPDRTAPSCPVFSRCGGCQWQMIDYNEQLRLKRRLVIDALERIGGFGQKWPMPLVHPVTPSQSKLFYRTKAQVPVGVLDRRLEDKERPGRTKRRDNEMGPRMRGKDTGKSGEGRGGIPFVAGFYAPGTHDIIDINECGIQHPISNRAIQVAREVCQNWGLLPYDEDTGKGFLRHIVTRVAPSTGQAMVVLVTAKKRFTEGVAIAREIMSCFDAVKSVSQNVNTKRTNVILGYTTILLSGKNYIEEKLGDLTFEISPTSFFQVNPPMAEVLYSKVCEYADPSPDDTVIDAYCGIGAISLFLARTGCKVIGIEESKDATRDASRNARRNDMENVFFEAGAVEDVLTRRSFLKALRPAVIVLDPPRTGCAETALKAFVDLAPRRIVYVSCYPATLARDLNLLAGYDYFPNEVSMVDLFPQTGHVESIVLMTNCGLKGK